MSYRHNFLVTFCVNNVWLRIINGQILIIISEKVVLGCSFFTILNAYDT